MKIAVTFEFSFVSDAIGGGHILFEDMIKVLDKYRDCVVFCFIADTETKMILETKYTNIRFISYGIVNTDSIFSRLKKIRQKHKLYQKYDFDKIISHTREVIVLFNLVGYRNKLILFIAYPKAVRFKLINKSNVDMFCFYIPILLRRVHTIYLSNFIKESTEEVLGTLATGDILRPYFGKDIIEQFNKANEGKRKIKNKISKKIKVISVGRIDFTQKPLLTYLKKLISITTNVELTIIGDGPDYEKLEKFLNIQRQETNINVTLHKNLPRIEIIKEMGKVDLALLPSEYESFMLTAYEAFLSGCSLIVNNVANLKVDFGSESSVFFLDDGAPDNVITAALQFVSQGKQIRNVGLELDRLQLLQEQYKSTLRKIIVCND